MDRIPVAAQAARAEAWARDEDRDADRVAASAVRAVARAWAKEQARLKGNLASNDFRVDQILNNSRRIL